MFNVNIVIAVIYVVNVFVFIIIISQQVVHYKKKNIVLSWCKQYNFSETFYLWGFIM